MFSNCSQTPQATGKRLLLKHVRPLLKQKKPQTGSAADSEGDDASPAEHIDWNHVHDVSIFVNLNICKAENLKYVISTNTIYNSLMCGD